MIYIVVFSITILLTYIYEGQSRRFFIVCHNKFFLFILGFLIVLFPALLGGFRDVSVGTDNFVYYEIFSNIRELSFSNILRDDLILKKPEPIEFGFKTYVWVISHINGNYHFFNFITSFLVFGLLFHSAKYYRKSISITLIIIVYLFIFYCANFNYVRQSMALSLTFYSLHFAQEHKLFKFLLIVVISTSIHITSVVMLPIYLLFLFCEKKHYNLILCLVSSVSVIVVLLGPRIFHSILVYLASFDIRSGVLLKYSRRFIGNAYSFNLNFLLRFMPQLILCGILYNRLVKINKFNRVYYSMIWIQIPLVIAGSVYDNFSRLALYFHYAILLLFPCSVKCFDRHSRSIVVFSLVLFCLLYWLIFTVTNHYHFSYPVYPYKFYF